MEREELARLILAELARPRWEGKFGPSSWDLRATLRDQGAGIGAPELAALLAWLREQVFLRYQSPRGVEQPTTVGNVKITPLGREQLARWSEPPPSAENG